MIPYQTPEEQYQYWNRDFKEKGDPLDLFKNVVNRSTVSSHPNRHIIV